MPFKYRLEKVLTFRIQKKDEQVEVVKAAETEVQRIQNEIDKVKQTIASLKSQMYSAQHTMLETYDNYFKHLYETIDKLEEEKQEAIKKLQEERELLLELEKAVKVLEKHKEKAREEYLKEERIIEMKKLDEVASVKHFRQSLERKNDEAEEEQQQYNEDYLSDEY